MLATSSKKGGTSRSYVPKASLLRLASLTRPRPILIHLVACVYILVTREKLPKFSLPILWLTIRKILLIDDLELQLMCFDCSTVPKRRWADARGMFLLIDERDALRWGPDAVGIYEWLARVLA